jgi:hypothetical protein
MGQPDPGNTGSSPAESIGGLRTTEGTETSHYLQEKKTNVIPLVAASEMGTAQTGRHVKACRFCATGVAGGCRTQLQQGREVTKYASSRMALERSAIEGDSPVDKR